ncbi:MAG: CotH kinase family protein [Saprospiraceae bacterium]|nr:CotH kinase family protein [Saprospiraceae bacterium]
MKITLSLLVILLSLSLKAQGFYDLSTIQTIEITFAESNWDQLLDAQKAGDEEYIMAQSISINGTVLDSVGVKYKGNSTYNANQVKNPFHIELDTYKDQDYEGYTDIKLSNAAMDPSFLREVLSYQIIRQYMAAPLSNFTNVYVNGQLIGLYSNSEAVSKKFVKKHFYSKDNAFIKCNPPGGAGPQSNDLPNLVYLGQDSASYVDAYELKSDIGWSDLIDLCDTLANHTAAIEQILDVDRAIWMLALDNVLVNLDSYIGAFAQNYYLYRDDSGRFNPVIWDLNESFGRFSMTGSGNLINTTAKLQMSHLLNSNDPDFPLVQKLLSVPLYKRMFLAHVKTILLENFDNESYYTTGLALQNTIKDAVQADNNKFFSYTNFINNLTQDVTGAPGPGGGSTPGITNLMDGRSNYLLAQSDFTKTEPTIANITPSNPTPTIQETITITAEVTNANSVLLGFRNHVEAPFVRIQMLDDGAHQDGTANDGIYGASIKIDNETVQYYIYAENADIGLFDPRRAEYEYHLIMATTTNPTVGDLVINEFMASNSITQSDQDGEYDDWVELYNNSTSPIDMSGYFLSDDVSDLTRWSIPAGTVINGKDYLIIWTDNDETQQGLHANFKLSALAESVVLSDASGVIQDHISYTDQVTDISFGRYPNGVGSFQFMNPTFQAENMLSTGIQPGWNTSFSMTISPNPASDQFLLEIMDEQATEKEVIIQDLFGRVVFQDKVSGTRQIDTANWPVGMYAVRADKTVLKLAIQR